jgi:hypothetical protein
MLDDQPVIERDLVRLHTGAQTRFITNQYDAKFFSEGKRPGGRGHDNIGADVATHGIQRDYCSIRHDEPALQAWIAD